MRKQTLRELTSRAQGHRAVSGQARSGLRRRLQSLQCTVTCNERTRLWGFTDLGLYSYSAIPTKAPNFSKLHSPQLQSRLRTSLVVQWLRLRAPNAGGPGSISDQGTGSHTLQLRVCMPQLKQIQHATTKRPHMVQLKESTRFN